MSVADLLTVITAGVEYRQADHGAGVVSGPVVNYGEIATTKRGRETVRPGSFLGLADPGLPVTLQHSQQTAQRITNGAGLTFRDTPTALYADLTLPDNDIGRSAAEGVRRGELTGWSTEFVPIMEASEQGVIAVYRAWLVGLGLVDVPAYSSSVVRLNRGGSGRFYYDRPIVSRDRGRKGDVRKETYKSRAFTRGFAEGRAVQLYLQNTGKGAVASTRTGSLVLDDTAAYLAFSVEQFASTTTAADFIALAEADALDFGVVPLIQVPPYPDAYTDVPEPGNPDVMIREYRDVILNGLLITNDKGVNQSVSEVMLNARRLAWL